MPLKHDPNQNFLLAALLDAEFNRLSPHLELVSLKLGDVLAESGSKTAYLYFPTTAIISRSSLERPEGASIRSL